MSAPLTAKAYFGFESLSLFPSYSQTQSGFCNKMQILHLLNVSHYCAFFLPFDLSLTKFSFTYILFFFAWGRKIRKTWIIEAWTLMNKSKNEQKIHVLPSKFSQKRLKIKSSCPKFLHLSSPLMYLLVKYFSFEIS